MTGLFEHHHAHHHEDEPALSVDRDPANQSLADALRVSFWVLKIVLLLLLGVYAASGVFNVSQQEAAVRLRFGRVVGEPGQQVLGPGGPYFAFPYPIEQVVRVPIAPGQVEINHAFWYEVPEASLGLPTSTMQGKAGPLDPRTDGSLLTGDANIVHARWTATYKVVDPVGFVTHVGDLAFMERLVQAAAEEGVVYAAAQLTADQLIKAQDLDTARARAEDTLDAAGSGVRVTSLTLKEVTFPLPVQPTVQSVLDAESEKARMVEAAHQRWNTVLGKTAGEAYRPLLGLIDEYERAVDSGDQARAWQLQDRFDEVFDRLEIEGRDRVWPIGGEVAAVMHDARSYRAQVVAKIRAETQYFESLLPQYRQNPGIVLNRLWQDAKQEILTGDIETIYLPPGQAYVELNRDPVVQQERERRRLSDEQSAAEEYE